MCQQERLENWKRAGYFDGDDAMANVVLFLEGLAGRRRPALEANLEDRRERER